MSKVWSNRFDSSLNPFIEEFNASISFDKTLIFEDIECSIAHAKMLSKTKVLSPDESLKIIEGLETIKEDFIEQKQKVLTQIESNEDVVDLFIASKTAKEIPGLRAKE